jgi:hypothetical protein
VVRVVRGAVEVHLGAQEALLVVRVAVAVAPALILWEILLLHIQQQGLVKAPHLN